MVLYYPPVIACSCIRILFQEVLPTVNCLLLGIFESVFHVFRLHLFLRHSQVCFALSLYSFCSLPEEETENQAPGEDNPPPLPPLPREWTPVPVNTHLTSMPAVSELKLSNAEKSKRCETFMFYEQLCS